MRRLAALAACLALCVACSDSEPEWRDVNATSTDQTRPSREERSEDEDEDEETSDTDPPASSYPIADVADPGAVECPEPTTVVSTADELQAALDDAAPGDVIAMAGGTYEGKFVATAQASADAPIFLCGGRDAVLDGGGIKAGYALHLDGTSGWRVVGFTVRNSQKGVMVDRGVDNAIQGLLVEQIGDEAIHLRAFSTDNVVRGNEIHDTGRRRDKFGEGVYVGSAVSNWEQHSGGEPDRSDRNLVIDNTIWDTSSEAVDIKEGTTGGVLRGNHFDGAGTSAADSWVDVKGNGWLVEGNTGEHAPTDGFQLHQIEEGWGTGNTFRGNVAAVDADGYGFATTNTDGNTVSCDNEVTGTDSGFADIPCT